MLCPSATEASGSCARSTNAPGRGLVCVMPCRLLCLFIFAALTGCGEKNVPVSSAPPEIFTDATGHPWTPLAPSGQKATVLLFLMHDCPVANASAPELTRLATGFSPRGVRFFGVYATETAAEILAHVRDYSLPFPGLLDPNLHLARSAGATRVPEAAVYSPSGELLYRGRIDDRAVRPGVTRPEPQRRDLRLALEAILAGRQPDVKFTESIGCWLPIAE